MRQLAFLDRVADLLLGRFFGLAVLVGGFGHASPVGPRRREGQAASCVCVDGSSNAPSPASLMAVEAIDLRARAISSALTLPAAEASSDSIMRRERAPIDDRT